MREHTYILGAGVTGLAMGMKSGLPILEAQSMPGGLCATYYLDRHGHRSSPEEDVYRFEYGGGHWIFSGQHDFPVEMLSLCSMRSYQRASGVFFPHDASIVPYPLQYHLYAFPDDVRRAVLREVETISTRKADTMDQWLEQSFGPTLYDLFFRDYHDAYTAGLFREIAPQDAYKNPVDLQCMRQGIQMPTSPAGYNTTFLYPSEGLGTLFKRCAEQCSIQYNKNIELIDSVQHLLHCSDGSAVRYNRLYSTIPLNRMQTICAIHTDTEPDPYTSVLVLNIGATKGARCPREHWLYVSGSESGFHRVGFYSNVENDFLPLSVRGVGSHVSMYVEKVYRGGNVPTAEEVESFTASVVRELQHWGFIDSVEVVDSTWIDVAYTWKRPGSTWAQEVTERLEECDIVQVGRYGRWHFQGIADSFNEGISLVRSLQDGTSTCHNRHSVLQRSGVSASFNR